MIVDGALYCLGYFGGRTAFVVRMLKKLRVDASQLDDLRRLWDEHPARTMFLGKFSYGIAQSFIVVAGAVKMDLRKFFGYGALAAVAQYITLVLLGYFLGNAFGGSVAAVINNIQYAVAGAALIISGYLCFSLVPAALLPLDVRAKIVDGAYYAYIFDVDFARALRWIPGSEADFALRRRVYERVFREGGGYRVVIE